MEWQHLHSKAPQSNINYGDNDWVPELKALSREVAVLRDVQEDDKRMEDDREMYVYVVESF